MTKPVTQSIGGRGGPSRCQTAQCWEPATDSVHVDEGGGLRKVCAFHAWEELRDGPSWLIVHSCSGRVCAWNRSVYFDWDDTPLTNPNADTNRPATCEASSQEAETDSLAEDKRDQVDRVVATGSSTVRKDAYRHDPDAAMAYGTRFGDLCWAMDVRVSPSHNERVLTAVVFAVAAAVDEEDLQHVGLRPDSAYLDVAAAVCGNRGDRVSLQLMQRVMRRSRSWTKALDGLVAMPNHHRAMLIVGVQAMIENAISVRDQSG